MLQICFTFLEASIASVFLVPFFLYLNKTRLHNWNRTVFLMLFSIYLAGVYSVAGLPNITYIRFDPNFNFVPFRYMFTAITSTILNVILFFPFGFFLFLIWKPFRHPCLNLLFGLFVSTAVETLQIFTLRATDINDLITNTLGTFFGWMLAWLLPRRYPRHFPDGSRNEISIVFGVVLFVMFFLHPFLSSLIWRIIP